MAACFIPPRHFNPPDSYRVNYPPNQSNQPTKIFYKNFANNYLTVKI